jgi:signal transduction histidine kinase
MQRRAQQLQKEAIEISNDVQTMSHELHSSKLEYLGVVPGIKSWCKEFGDRHGIEIDFNSDVISGVPFKIGVSLFRVLQEALHNAAKHSGAKHIEVRVTEHANEIRLTVVDSGKGFDVESAMQGKGLGLISMRERARLVNGIMEIKSKPMGGTRIDVRMPFDEEWIPHRAAG